MKRTLNYTILFFWLTTSLAIAQSVKITRGPYLQVVTPTSVIVRWRTDQATTGAIWFGTSQAQLTNSVRESKATKEHQITLSGLKPATKYNYAVGYDETKLASGEDYYVKTAPPTGDTRPVRFWVLGDFGVNSANQGHVYNSYKKIAATYPADLWVWLGDNAYWGGLEEQYQEYVFDFYPQTLRNLPVFMTPGNHDYAESRTNFNITYYNSFSFPEKGEAGGVPSNTKTYYSADYGNVHLVSLDSQANQSDGFRLYDTTSTQVQWLKQDLAATKQPWKIVIFHHPPYSKGGHDSDLEEQMVLIRERLTPILERYGVDVVLNGHSHGYERTYRLKGLTGKADTFDKNKNLAEQTTGRYDGSPNSCPILAKGEGTVYVINGSGGQLGGKSGDFPHPATVYNNVTVGGSMLIDVTDNRLDAQFVLTDGSIPDRFTILKNVNKTIARNAQYGDTLQLSASWPGQDGAGTYRWESGQTSRQIRYDVDKVGAFPITVKDQQNCLTDVFQLTVPRPKLTTRTSAMVCAGQSFNVATTLENTTHGNEWQYDVFLSNATGDFAQERLIGSGKLNELKATLPTNMPAGTGYRLRVRPRDKPMVELVPSEPLKLGSSPTATLAGSTTITQGESLSLSIAFTGDGPWKGTLSEGTTFSGAVNPMVIQVKPSKTTVYSVASVENACGKGTASGQTNVTVLIPTGEEDFPGGQLRVYPNPVHNVLNVELMLTQKKDVNVQIIDTQGRSVFQQQAGQVNTLSEAIPIPPINGVYLLRIQVGGTTVTRKVVRQ